MIVGNGNIAKVLTDRNDVIYFASGVSDSQCQDYNEFKREKDLLLSMPKNIHLVYFSNLGIFRWVNKYIDHKKEMEELIKNNFNSYSILRVEVLRWAKNKKTIHNYFKHCINNNLPVNIQNTHRYVLSLDEFLYWVSLIRIGHKEEINIMGEKMHVIDIYKLVLENKL